MSRSPKIRITKNDRQEYNRLVKNTKAKLRRAKKNYGVDLSHEIDLPSLSSFETRKDFNKWKEEIQRYNKRTNRIKRNDYGVVATQKYINDIKKANKESQKFAEKLREEANEKPFISSGKVQGTVGQRLLQMGKPNTAGVYRPPDFHFDEIRSQRGLIKSKENYEKRSNPNYFNERTEKMKENFAQLLEEAFNSDGEALADFVRGMPTDDFYEMYLMFDELDFDLYYNIEGEPDGTHPQLIQLEHYMNQYLNNQIDFDLKGFPNKL